MFRKRVNRRKDRKRFSRTVRKANKRNFTRANIKRGGIRF